ncbi:MAG: Rieske 2Fe-2S domain-containing protein [Gammaproteobacteria bacterium]
MKLTYIGHAGFLFETEQAILIMDPWLSNKGAFDSAWFQLPSNHHLFEPLIEKIKNNKTYLYISHEHRDHFDSDFLQHIVPFQPELIISNFHNKYLYNGLKALGFKNITQSDDETTIKRGPFTCTYYIDDRGINQDSAILVEAEGFSFLNLNDCKIFDRIAHIKEKHPNIDCYAAQFSGAVWHPTCYELPKEKYQEVAKQKKLSKFNLILRSIETLQPKRYLPTAGPAVFLDPALLAINFEEENIFPQQFSIIEYLEPKIPNTQVDPIMPGDVFDTKTNEYTTLAETRLNKNNYQDYIKQYAKQYEEYFSSQKHEYTSAQQENLMERLYKELTHKASKFKSQSTVHHTLYFTIDNLQNDWIEVDLNTQQCCRVSEPAKENYYLIRSPAWEIERVLNKDIDWAQWALTFRCRLKRSPDEYETLINLFLISEADELPHFTKIVDDFSNNDETIEIEANGKHYCIRRYCPHQGGDLKYGWAEGDLWVCPRHRWKYDLSNDGQCSNTKDSIHAKEIDKKSAD